MFEKSNESKAITTHFVRSYEQKDVVRSNQFEHFVRSFASETFPTIDECFNKADL